MIHSGYSPTNVVPPEHHVVHLDLLIISCFLGGIKSCFCLKRICVHFEASMACQALWLVRQPAIAKLTSNR